MSDSEQLDDAFARMSDILSQMVSRAEQMAGTRCVYRNRADECTAAFGCRNQGSEQPPSCRFDAPLNYHRA